MRLEQLEFFLAIVRFGSFSMGAENLHVSQPALSKAIKLLEGELGVRLFSRVAGGAALTPEGQELLPLIQNVMGSVATLHKKAGLLSARQCGPQQEGRIIVYSGPTIMDTFLYAGLKRFTTLYPKTDICLELTGKEELLSMNLSTCEGVIIYVNTNNEMDGMIAASGMNCDILFSDKRSVVVGKRSPLATNKIVNIEDVLDYQQIFPYNKFGQTEHYMKTVGRTKPIDILMYTNNVSTIKDELSRNRNAVHIANNILAKKNFSGDSEYVVIPIKNVKSKFFALYNKNCRNAEQISRLVSVIKDMMRQ